MSETITSEFRIQDFTENSVELKELTVGYIVFVQYEKRLYTGSLWDEIKTFTKEDVVTISVTSQNTENTIWKISEVHN